MNNHDSDTKANQTLQLSDLQAKDTDLVRASDIDRLAPEIRDQFQVWIRGQTMMLIDGEAWVYPTDWRRFMAWHESLNTGSL